MNDHDRDDKLPEEEGHEGEGIEREIDEDLQRLKTGLDAQKEWTKTAVRIADSLEHFTMSQVVMQLTAMNLIPGPMPPIRHHAGCPMCHVLKGAKQRAIGGIVPANGAILKKPNG